MKKLFLIGTILWSMSCKPIISNDQATLDKIFQQEKFELEVQSYSCFSGPPYIFDISKEKKGYLIPSRDTKKYHVLSDVKIDSLKSFLSSRINSEQPNILMDVDYVRVGKFYFSVDYYRTDIFYDKDELNKLLNHYDLVQDN